MSLTPGKDASALEKLLTSFSQGKVAWYELAEAIALAEQNSASPGEAASYRALAVGASGYSAGLINRYVATYNRIKMISADGGPLLSDMLAPAFNTVEAAVKLFELDREKGMDAFRRLKDGDLTLSTVRSELTDAKVRVTDLDLARPPAALSSGLQFLSKDVRRRRQNDIVSALQRGYAPLSGQYEEMSWRHKNSFLASEGIYHIRREKDHYGLETVVMASEKGPRFIDTILSSSIVRAKFFRQYYLAFWCNEPTHQIKRADWLLGALGEKTIGILLVGQDGLINEFSKAETSVNPDLVARMQKLLSLITEHGTLEKST